MSDNNPSDDLDERRHPEVEDPSGRLGVYLSRTRTPLDLLAVLTLWIVVVPYDDFGSAHHFSTIALIVRIGVSVIYAIDMAIRATLAKRHLWYLLTHPVGVLSVPFPPVRVIFSLRLFRSVFRRGNLWRFMLVASILVLNGAIIVDLFERHAPGSSIHTFGESLWWSIVTVTTVGYGDFVPVTVQGRITAVFIMGIGILTLAVVTAQVSSSFIDQAARRRQESSAAAPATTDVLWAELHERLARIEALLTASTGSTKTGEDTNDALAGSPRKFVWEVIRRPGSGWLAGACSCWLMRRSSAVRSRAENFQLNGRAGADSSGAGQACMPYLAIELAAEVGQASCASVVHIEGISR